MVSIKHLETINRLLETLHNWLETEQKRTLPKSLLGKALNYTLKQWPKLIVFL